jgi:hypothetical protein
VVAVVPGLLATYVFAPFLFSTAYTGTLAVTEWSGVP